MDVIDGRIPLVLPSKPLSGRAEISGGYNTDFTAMARFDGGRGAWAWHADALYRDRPDLRIPGGSKAEACSNWADLVRTPMPRPYARSGWPLRSGSATRPAAAGSTGPRRTARSSPTAIPAPRAGCPRAARPRRPSPWAAAASPLTAILGPASSTTPATMACPASPTSPRPIPSRRRSTSRSK